MKDRIFVVIHSQQLESENDIYIVKAANRDDALIQYAKQHFSDDRYFIEEVGGKTLGVPFWDQFFTSDIYAKDGSPVKGLKYEERTAKLKINIENYLGENRHLASELIDFYHDEDKTYEDLSDELKECIAIKEVQAEKEHYVIKEIISSDE